MQHHVPKESGIREKSIDVLVVDDDADCRLLLATALSAAGCIVLAVDGAEAAYDAVQRRVPDVVITDLRLIGGSAGWTLADALREGERTRHVGLVAVTGVVAPAMQVVAPFDAYLRKPVDLALVAQIVQQLARASRTKRRAQG